MATNVITNNATNVRMSATLRALRVTVSSRASVLGAGRGPWVGAADMG
jgi:hypothetical protein